MSPSQQRSVNSKIWKTCAGPSVNVPKLQSKVYYFPQGHLEHAFPSPNAHTITVIDGYRPSIPCIVTAVDLLADPHTDEVFAKLLLSPVTDGQELPEVLNEEDDGDKVVSFVKTLTKSDSNNGGGFSVPRQCADLIFPKLDLDAPLPSQQLSITDAHGVVWKFTHVYRGRPKRYLFTTGWTPFVNNKKLVAGDSVVFMKNSAGNLFVGIRRYMKFTEAKAEQSKVVMEAVESAEKNMAFEVLFYPRDNSCNFVVDAKVVDDAMKIRWTSGMRVKIPLKTNESSNSKITFFQPQGTISDVSNVPNWRMLQVNWDEPEISQSSNRVNPWQVELISHTPAVYLPFLSTKKPRLAHDSSFFSDTKGDPFIPMIEFPFSTVESLNHALLNCGYFPAGMQGARHDTLSVSDHLSISGSSNSLNDKGYGFFVNNSMAGLSDVSSTSVNIGMCTSNELSPHNHSSLNTCGTKLAETHNSSPKRVSSRSIKLFGKIIQPVESNVHDSGTKGEDDCKGCNENECIDKE